MNLSAIHNSKLYLFFLVLSLVAYFDPRLKLYTDTLRTFEFCEFRPFSEYILGPFGSHFFPFTKTIYFLEYHLFQDTFVGYRFFSILLHASCVFLLFDFLFKEFNSKKAALFSAIFFSGGAFATSLLTWHINLGNQFALLSFFLCLKVARSSNEEVKSMRLRDLTLFIFIFQVGLYSFESFLPLSVFISLYLMIKNKLKHILVPLILMMISGVIFLFLRSNHIPKEVAEPPSITMLFASVYMFWNGIFSPVPFSKLLLPVWLCYGFSFLSLGIFIKYLLSAKEKPHLKIQLLALSICFLLYLLYASARIRPEFENMIKARYHYLPMVMTIIFITPFLKHIVEKLSSTHFRSLSFLFFMIILLNIGVSRIIIEKYWIRYDENYVVPEINDLSKFMEEAKELAMTQKVILPDIYLSVNVAFINASFAQKLFLKETTHKNIVFVQEKDKDHFTQPLGSKLVEWQKGLTFTKDRYLYGVFPAPHPRDVYTNDYQK